MGLNILYFIRVNVACYWICLSKFTGSLRCRIEKRIETSYVACKWNCAMAFAINVLLKIKIKTLIVEKIIGFATWSIDRYDLQVEQFL